MMGRKQKLNNKEYEILTHSKRLYKFKSRVRKLLKRAVNKRARKDKVEVKEC